MTKTINIITTSPSKNSKTFTPKSLKKTPQLSPNTYFKLLTQTKIIK